MTETVTPTATPDKKKRILIAEDDPVSRRLLEVFLVKWGFEVVVATNGTDALQFLERMDAPRLAVLDWMMPGLEGRASLPEIARHYRSPLHVRAAAYGAGAERGFVARA